MGSVRRRLEALEDRIPSPESPARDEARRKMREHLDRLIQLRRGELSEEEAAEVRAVNAAVERQIAKRRGRVVVNG